MPGISDYIQEHHDLEKAAERLGDLASAAIEALSQLEGHMLTRTLTGTWACRICGADGSPDGVTHRRTCPFQALDKACNLRDELEAQSVKRGVERIIGDRLTLPTKRGVEI